MKFKNALLSLVFVANYINAQNVPNVTVIFVIDQFAHHYLEKVQPHFKYGLKKLFDNGIVYQHAHYPHGMPSTAVGHTALNTGVQSKDHGIIGNYWIDENNEEYPCDKDSPQTAAVFAPRGFYNYGRSAHNVMVDGVSDQIMLSKKPGTKHVCSFSLKSRSAITCAGKAGKAFWYDETGHQFTSSKAYFDTAPSWLLQFNKYFPTLPKEIVWESAYPLDAAPYNSVTHSYKYTRTKKPIVGEKISVTSEDFLKTPLLQKMLLDCAQTYFDANVTKDKNGHFVMWISMSALDKTSHIFGPWSKESLDILYHADKDIGTFMNHIERTIPSNKILYVLTADHGTMPIPELLQEKGLNAKRINSKELIKSMNELLSKKMWLKNLVQRYKTPQFFFDAKTWVGLADAKKKSVMDLLIPFLESKAGIKKVWETQKLALEPVDNNSIESFFKNQLFPGRSGQITVQVYPYVYLSKHDSGTGHKTPYGYDTHVPLVLYQRGSLQRKKIHKHVWMQQFANTLADILHVARPSASLYEPLPLR